MRLLYWVIVIVTVALLVAAVAGGGGSFLAPPPSAGGSAPSLERGGETSPLQFDEGAEEVVRESRVGTNIGERAPDFRLTDVKGGAVKLSALRGRFVLLNFWTSTCPYCREEMPMLQKLSERYPEIAVIGVNVLEDKDVIETFLWELGISYLVLQDGWGEVSSLYQVTKIPATILIEEQGVIVWRTFGAVRETELGKQVQNLHER